MFSARPLSIQYSPLGKLTTQPAADAPAPTTTDVEVPSTEQVKETAAPAPEDVAATTVVEPLKDDVNKLPTVTHAEAGTAHKETDVATNVAGEQADKPAVSTETPAAPAPAPVAKVDEAPKEASPKKEATKVCCVLIRIGIKEADRWR